MTLTIHPVLLQHFHQSWPLVERFLSKALEWSGNDYTIEQAKVYLARGEWALIVAVDEQNAIKGAAAVNFFNMPNDRVAFVIAMGGRLICNNDTFNQFVSVLKSFGATKLQGAARESAARLYTKFGLKERYRIMESTL